MEKERIERISALTALSRQRELTPEETAEREALRKEYIADYRENMRQMLQNVRIREEDGTLSPLRRKDEPSA